MADQGFPASRRLHSSEEFDAVYKDNEYRISKPEFLILACRNNVNHNRLGMVVQKRITGGAFDRNRFKRLIREVFRKTPLASLDFLVLTRPKANLQPNHLLSEILSNSITSIVDQSRKHGPSTP